MASKSLCPAVHPKSFATLGTTEGEFCNEEILCRLIHFWEARNFKKGNILMGFELLLIDAECNTIQGFISANRLFRYEKDLKANSVYKLKKFMIRPCKTRYKTSDHKHGMLFTDQTTMVEVPEGADNIDHQKFRPHLFSDFSAIADRETDLFDVLGHIRYVSGDNLRTHTPENNGDEVLGNRAQDRVFLHLLMTDGQTVRVYLWGNIAEKFRQRWNKSSAQPVALLITTVNPKTLGGAVTLSSTSSTRLFLDTDIAETKEFMTQLSSRTVPAISSSSSAITKLETVTINELHQFLQNETPQIASFYCFATIVDILGQYGWNYISCSSYNTKLGKTEMSLYCTTCKKTNNIGLLRYRFEVTVRDENKDGGTFVIFDSDGINLAGRRAAEIQNESHEAASDNDRERINTHVLQCLKNIVGRTCKFQLKVKPYNFGASRQTFTVSRILDEEAETKSEVPKNTIDDVEEKDATAEKKDTHGRQTTDSNEVEVKIDLIVGDPTTTMESASSKSVYSTAKKENKRPRLET